MVLIARTDITERFSSHAPGIFSELRKQMLSDRQNSTFVLTSRLQAGKNTMSHIIGEKNQMDAEKILDQLSKVTSSISHL